MRDLTDIELGYLAGIIDGEGTISVSYMQSKTGRSPSLGCRVSVGNTSRDLLEWLAANVGGKIYGGKIRMENAKPYWTWVLLGRPAIVLVALIEPHLKIKRQQAILTQQIEALLLPRWGDKKMRVVTDELRTKRDALAQQFRDLNAKGTS